MPNPCLGITCEVAPDTAIYSLSTNLSFNGTPISVVVPCPEGFICSPTTVTYPPGTFIVPDPPPLPPGSDPCTPRQPFRVQGCLSEIIVAIPLCSTAAQIAALAQTVIQQMALQQAQCDVYPPVTPPGGGGGTFPPPTPIVFTNAAQSVQCSNPNNVFNITALPSIPGITFAGGFLTAAAGIFGYPTQEAADAAAVSFLEGLRDELLLDGDATCICFASFTATPGVSEITLNWSAVAGAGAYFISVATSGPEGPYQFLAPAQSGLSYVHSDPVVGQTYYYKINAYDNVSLSGSFLCGSDVISAQTSNDCECWPFEGTILSGLGFDTGWSAYEPISNRAFINFEIENSVIAIDPTKTIAQNPVISTLDPVVSDAAQDIGPRAIVAAAGNIYVLSSYINVSRFIKISRINPATNLVDGFWEAGGYAGDASLTGLAQMVHDSVNQKLYFAGTGTIDNTTAIHVFDLVANTFSSFDQSPLSDGSHGTRVEYDPVAPAVC